LRGESFTQGGLLLKDEIVTGEHLGGGGEFGATAFERSSGHDDRVEEHWGICRDGRRSGLGSCQ